MSAPAPIRPASLAVSRSNFGFSPDGREVACVRTSEEISTLELWDFGTANRSARPHSLRSRSLGTRPAHSRASRFPQQRDGTARALHRGTVVDPSAQATPLGEGRVLLLTTDHELAELELIDTAAARSHLLGQVRAQEGYLLASPSAAQLGFLIAREDRERSAVWRITDGPPGVEPLVRLPGAASGGVWLDTDADLLALNLTRPDRRVEGVLVDLRRGSWQPLFSLSADSDDRILLHHQGSKLLLVRSTADGSDRLGWVVLDGASTVRFPDRLTSAHVPLAVDGGGQRVLLRRDSGALSALELYAPREDKLTPLSLPPGSTGDRACLPGKVVRVPFSSPARPSTLVTLAPSGACSTLPEDSEASELPPWASADLLRLGGGIEAIVYGGGQWRSCSHLVLALHPLEDAVWRWEFHPLFQDLAAVGVAVIAANHRDENGAWGAPGLPEILSLGHHLRSQRPGLPGSMLIGGGHGGRIALRAAGTAPDLWSGCAALAPELLADDELPRTITSVTSPLLLVHGVEDEVVPVQRARQLRRAVAGLGAAGPELRYFEVAGDHRGVAAATSGALRERIVSFCRGGTAPSPGSR
ncbi:S9 family peptidase [Saccharopolyspora sp. SCSIO 74807]|uniref:alpha/beta hydrolase family protein n=2 Tax=unclassified Saccharopolyspora TaxID=2646250 RepID=UPI0030D2F44E